jgi:hypothetical protein
MMTIVSVLVLVHELPLTLFPCSRYQYRGKMGHDLLKSFGLG